MRADEQEMARCNRHLDIDPIVPGDEDIRRSLAFLATPTDTASVSGASGPPPAVPSGLPMD